MTMLKRNRIGRSRPVGAWLSLGSWMVVASATLIASTVGCNSSSQPEGGAAGGGGSGGSVETAGAGDSKQSNASSNGDGVQGDGATGGKSNGQKITDGDKSGVDNSGKSTLQPMPAAPKPDPTAKIREQLQAAADHGQSQRWDEAAAALGKAGELAKSAGETERFADEIVKATEAFETARREHVARQRTERLALARQQLEAGKLDDSQTSLGEVLSRGPTDEQRQEAADLSAEIERRRKARRQLKSWMTMLASQEPKEVQTAQSQLLQDPDTALGMVLEALRATSEAGPAKNFLETLRELNRPDVVAPALVELLDNEQQKSLWPEVATLLREMPQGGAGPALLKRAVEAQDAGRRATALSILAALSDPPAATVSALAPLTGRADSEAEMPLVLRAMARAVLVHGQRDWVARRGFDSPLAPPVEAELAKLPARLDAWLAADAKSSEELRASARTLAVLLGRVPAQPLTGLKIVRAEGETPESPAAAVLDGVWNSIEAKTMWRHPATVRGALLIDLGQSRTVTSVRVWNWNEPSGGQRGWKEFEIYVSDSPAELTPVATGIVPPAPGAANTPDYGTLVPIPPTVGRYVRLQAKSTWTTDSHSGLAEVQLLGF